MIEYLPTLCNTLGSITSTEEVRKRRREGGRMDLKREETKKEMEAAVATILTQK